MLNSTTFEVQLKALESEAAQHVVDGFKAYRCGHCDEIHRDKDDAEYCCTQVKNVIAYECPKCKSLHGIQINAVRCCNLQIGDFNVEKIPDGIKYQLNQLHLEHAGQVNFLTGHGD